jgi:hypothetical protein
MGLTIHYHFDAGSRPLTEIRHLIEVLHSTAADLPFELLDKEIVELVGEECHLTGSGEDKWSLLKIRAMKFRTLAKVFYGIIKGLKICD